MAILQIGGLIADVHGCTTNSQLELNQKECYPTICTCLHTMEYLRPYSRSHSQNLYSSHHQLVFHPFSLDHLQSALKTCEWCNWSHFSQTAYL
ncbi:unnamed protein product [Sphagnum balticum]